MAKPHGEWEYLYKTTTTAQLPWELGGPDVCLERLVQTKKLPAKGAVLDLGCGLGSAAVYLAALKYTVTGVDISPTAIEKANAKAGQVGVPVTFLVGTALAIPVKAKAFDVVYDRGCFQHLRREDWSTYKQEILRVLKPKGIFLLEVTQEQVSLDDLRTLFGRSFEIRQAEGVTHVERPTGIPRYHTFAVLVRR